MSGTTTTKVTKGRSQVKVLEPDQVCDIIKTGAEHGVALLKFGELEIWFGQTIKPGVTPAGPTANASPEPATQPTPVAEMTEQQHDKQTENAILQNEIELREQQIAEYLVTDPLKAEELIEQGELQDADDEHGDDE